MKYVDDLTKVKPEEIKHVNDDVPIQQIIKAKNPCNEAFSVGIVYEDGSTGSYTIDGRVRRDGVQLFAFNPKKVKYLKQLDQVIAEAVNAGEEVEIFEGLINCRGWEFSIPSDMFEFFGRTLEELDDPGFCADSSWIEEREV